MSAFETPRLVVREPRAEDLDALLEVYASNPDYLELTEGSGGEPGRYDRDMLERDVGVAQLTPGRRLAGIFLRDGGDAVGVLDWMEANPTDGIPWVGLLIIRRDRQRHGLASEAFAGLANELRARGQNAIRAGVIDRNPEGHALVHRLGFEPVSRTTMRMTAEEEVTIFELRLSSP